jgi:pimeloyl-ACP methyl ester carboxylesterase
MATADVARDLDRLREAVGDEQLTYVGFSYGSYLGVTYANLFPDKFRMLVVDGVLNPIEWATGMPGEGSLPFSTRLRSDDGALATLNEFFRLCDAGGPNCAFSPGSADRFGALAAKLRAEPLVIITAEGITFTFTYADLIANALGAMYDSSSWPDFAQFLAGIEAADPPAELGAKLFAVWQDLGFITKRGFPQYPNFVEGFPGVACADSNNPNTYSAWSAAAADSEAQHGYFGRIWTWASSICAAWPGSDSDRYIGPFAANTTNPVLVANKLFDPATRYQGAVFVAGLLPNARLLTVRSWGHTTLFSSHLADQAVAPYLLEGTLPAEGTVYDQDFVPFAPATTSATAAIGSQLRARVIPAMVPSAMLKSVHTKANRSP